MSEPSESIRKLLGNLHEERVWTWSAEALKVNVEQRARLVAEAKTRRFVQAGDRIPSFTLNDTDGQTITDRTLTAVGPAVLIFFRFAGCPACNIALPYYDRNLRPALERLGVKLVAVSPQVAERLVEIKDRHSLGFTVASDPDNALAHRFELTYAFDESSKKAALAAGRFIGDVTGTGTWELPQPAVIALGQDGRVAFADVSPDWMVRTEANTVLEAVRPLVLGKAA